jgi:hypothetical protein
MGLMDFLKKRNDSGMGSDGLNLETGSTFDSHIPQSTPNYGMEMQQDPGLSPSMNLSTMNNTGFGQSPMQQSFSQQPMQNNDLQKDLQMISLKLDAIKSDIDSMNQRLKNLESIAEREQSKTTKKWY